VELADTPRYSSAWLGLREGADAAARSADLLIPLRERFHDAESPLLICDLGCGTGSMARWLAGRLPGPQHWVLVDRDPDLLDVAAASTAELVDASGAGVTVETRTGDVAGLAAADLAGVSLVTASALLDLLTRDEVDRLAAACVDSGTPALLTLTVTGAVELTPADPLDADLAAAFRDHLRHNVDGRGLLGPDAAAATETVFTGRGATVRRAATPWRLGPERADLQTEWLRGWAPAAFAQRPGLAEQEPAYLGRRLAEAASGELRVVVHHDDLLALPADGPAPGGPAGARSDQ
jgi:SAM-dependent methyltransferase